jgi:ATP-dependent exoDNAse (exonuclease V) alpha subunit
MTLDNVYLDLARGAFAHGQTYVALSRCRSMNGLALARPLRPDDIIVDPNALAYRSAFEAL